MADNSKPTLKQTEGRGLSKRELNLKTPLLVLSSLKSSQGTAPHFKQKRATEVCQHPNLRVHHLQVFWIGEFIGFLHYYLIRAQTEKTSLVQAHFLHWTFRHKSNLLSKENCFLSLKEENDQKTTEQSFPFKRSFVKRQISLVPLGTSSSQNSLSTKAPWVCFSSYNSWPLKVEPVCYSKEKGVTDRLWPVTEEAYLEKKHFCKCKLEPGLLTQRKINFLRRFCSSSSSRTHHSPQVSPTVSQLNTELKVPMGLSSKYFSTQSKTWAW